MSPTYRSPSRCRSWVASWSTREWQQRRWSSSPTQACSRVVPWRTKQTRAALLSRARRKGGTTPARGAERVEWVGVLDERCVVRPRATERAASSRAPPHTMVERCREEAWLAGWLDRRSGYQGTSSANEKSKQAPSRVHNARVERNEQASPTRGAGGSRCRAEGRRKASNNDDDDRSTNSLAPSSTFAADAEPSEVCGSYSSSSSSSSRPLLARPRRRSPWALWLAGSTGAGREIGEQQMQYPV